MENDDCFSLRIRGKRFVGGTERTMTLTLAHNLSDPFAVSGTLLIFGISPLQFECAYDLLNDALRLPVASTSGVGDGLVRFTPAILDKPVRGLEKGFFVDVCPAPAGWLKFWIPRDSVSYFVEQTLERAQDGGESCSDELEQVLLEAQRTFEQESGS